jgi:starch synthase
VVWDPASDARIAQRYDARTLEGKSANKAALQRRLNLGCDAGVPLIGVVSRLTHQKGIDLLAGAVDALVACLRSSRCSARARPAWSTRLRARLRAIRERWRSKWPSTKTSRHAVEAGADLFAMPSRFEPCGLKPDVQPALWHAAGGTRHGGLVDTVQDGVTGFLFERAESDALHQALKRASAAYADPRAGEACSAPGWSGTSAGRQPLVATQISTWRLPGCCSASRDFGRCLGVLGVPGAQLLEQHRVVLAADRPAAGSRG